MCGIVGAVGTLAMKHEDAFKDLLTVDVIRGPHSTGICSVSRGMGVHVVKKPLLPTDMFQLNKVQDMFFRQNYLFIGHNRWATMGAVNEVNAHPFQFETLVGVHNGTLQNQRLLPDFQDFEVDSENVFHSIQKLGIDETYGNLHGAAALVWYDIELKQVNFIRNKERPMFITFTKDRKVMFYASEAWMLEGVLNKHGIEYTELFDTAVDTLYTVDIPLQGDVFDKTNARILTPYVPAKKSQWEYSQHKTGTTSNSQATSTETGGFNHAKENDPAFQFSYSVGDYVSFRINKDSPTDKRYIMATDAWDSNAFVRIHCSKNSWLREYIEDNDETIEFQGVVNGSSWSAKAYGVDVQENSVYLIDEDEEDNKLTSNIIVLPQDLEDMDMETFGNEQKEHQWKVLQRCNYKCGICDDKLGLDERHVILSEDSIICHDCSDTDFAKELINTY